MARKISIILMLTIFALSLFGASAFAAKAKNARQSAEIANLKAVSQPAVLASDSDDQAVGSSKPGSTVMQSLGYLAANGIVNTGQITQFDLPSNGSQPRQIAVSTAAMSCASKVSAAFRFRPAGQTAASESHVQAITYTPGGAIANGQVGGDGGGYPAMVVNKNGTPIAVYHNAVTAPFGTYAALEFTCGVADFQETPTEYPDTVAVASGMSEHLNNYIWPQAAADLDASGNWFVHVVSHESPPTTDTSGYQTLVYWRSNANSINPLGTIGTIIDTVDWINGTVIAAPLQADQRVAVVYGKPRIYGASLNNNDNIVYRESSNLGATWGPVQTIKNYGTAIDPKFNVAAARERGWETSGLYTADGCLHVLFLSSWVDTSANSFYPFPARLWHWNQCNVAATNIVDEIFIAAATCAIGGTGSMRGLCKANLTECGGRLYASYSKQVSTEGDDVLPDFRDCSTAGWTNFELFARVSSTAGATWGPDSNLTNTHDDNCAGNCRSELSLGAVERDDSLRIAYIEDKEAGIGISGNSTLTDNPVKILTRACFNMATFQSLASTPAEVRYPFHTVPAGIKDTSIVLTNSGNVPAPYTTAITYLSGAGWLAFGGTQGPSPSGSVTAGAVNTELIGLRATGPASEGFYQAEVKFTYNSPSVVVTVPVDLYNFVRWTLPKDVSIRTSLARINVNQASEIANNVAGRMFSYFSDTSDYIYDGFLIIGNSAANMTYSTFNGGGSSAGQPTPSNPYGFLYASSDSMTSDSTTFGGYRYATGKGYNRDSTIEFTSEYYAPKHPDSANFFVLRYSLYHGPKDTGTAITGLTLAYYADMDVPADTLSDNIAGWDTTLTGTIRRATLYQQGTLATSPNNNQNRFAALGGAIHNGFPPIGGFAVGNPTYIYPESGWENDSLWNELQLIPALTANSGGRYSVIGPYAAPSGTPEDLSSVLLLQRGAQIRSAGLKDTLKVTVLVAGTPKTGSLTILNQTMDRAYKFMRTNKLRFCRCGDADGNGAISISDAVKTINFIFAGGSAPNPLCRGDADGNGSISISDAVKLINFIFGGGAAPEKC